MNRNPARYQLRYGPYATPRFHVGQAVFCEMRGWVRVAGLSAGPIPWPRGRRPGAKNVGMILYADLARAVRRESSQAVAFWWRVGLTLVWKWRKTLGVPYATDGTRAACGAWVRPASIGQKVRRALAGRKPTAEQRAKMSAAHKRRGTRPPKARRPWQRWEDRLLAKLRPPEVAERTGRTPNAVKNRRHVMRKALGLPDGRAGRKVPR